MLYTCFLVTRVRPGMYISGDDIRSIESKATRDLSGSRDDTIVTGYVMIAHLMWLTQ